MNDNLDELSAHRPTALRIAALRRAQIPVPLTRQDLARLAGITVRQLQWLETTRYLPRVIESLHATALALELPIEDLLHPQVREDHAGIIEERRRILGLASASGPESS